MLYFCTKANSYGTMIISETIIIIKRKECRKWNKATYLRKTVNIIDFIHLNYIKLHLTLVTVVQQVDEKSSLGRLGNGM